MSIVTLGRPRHVPIIVVDTSNLPYVVWLEYRQSGIGGSDVAAVYGLSPFMTMKDLYWDKIGLKPAVSDERNWIEKQVGKLLEDFVAEIFEKKTGLKIHKVKKMYRHPHHEYMLADLDYVVEHRDGELGVLEIKTSHPANKINWARNGIPYHVNLQGRHYMAVTDYSFCYFACLFGNNDFIIRYITRNHEFENQMIQDEGNFWYQYVAALKEPPYVESPDLVLASLGRHYGAGDKSVPIVDLSTDWVCDIQRYMELKVKKAHHNKMIREIDEEMKRIYAPIAEVLGKATNAVILDGSRKFNIQYMAKDTPQINKDDLIRLQANYPEIYREYVTTSSTRSFSVKENAA